MSRFHCGIYSAMECFADTVPRHQDTYSRENLAKEADDAPVYNTVWRDKESDYSEHYANHYQCHAEPFKYIHLFHILIA